MRDTYEEILALGGEVIAIGTGDVASSAAFAEEEEIPYRVLADPDGTAAASAEIESVGAFRLFHPKSFSGAARAYRAGHRVRGAGNRVTQLGSTFVLGPGPVVRYAHRDAHTADHAPLTEVLAALD